MKLLLDENLPVKLKSFFSDSFEVSTVSDEGWSGTKNSALLELMTQYGFDLFISIDKNLRYQQNIDIQKVKIAILNAPDNKLSTLQSYIKKLELLLSKTIETHLFEVNI